MKGGGKMNSKTLAMHGKELKGCKEEGIGPERGNLETSESFLHKALPGLD
jgi:hypothetical protein